MDSKSTNKKNKNRLFSGKSIAVLIMAVIFVALLGIASVQQNHRAREYEKQIEELDAQIKDLEAAKKKLEEEKEQIGSDDYIRRIARERLGMIDEKEYKMEKSDDTSGGGH